MDGRATLGAIAAAALVAACGDATGAVRGGEARDASLPFDAGISPDAAVDGGAPCAPATGDAGTPTFTELYDTLLGPSGAASCAGSGQCHGDASQEGAVFSGGYVCSDEATCYKTLIASSLVPVNDPGDPTHTVLYTTLRHTDPRSCATVGNMPLSPAIVLTPDEMQGIAAWTAAGAPNN